MFKTKFLKTYDVNYLMSQSIHQDVKNVISKAT